MRLLPGLLLAALLPAACAVPGPGATPAPGTMLSGNWGGEHVALSLSPAGGTIEYDCANGTLDAGITPDGDGAFRVAGRHVRGSGGPERVGVQPSSVPATYLGQVSGDRMQLRVRLEADTLGPFILHRGAAPQLLKCL